MLNKIITICVSILTMNTFSQENNIRSFPKDTTYTLQSAYNKYKKEYPFIKPIQHDPLNNRIQKADIIYNNSSADRPLLLDIFFSSNDDISLKPAVVLIHGGGWSSGNRMLMYPLADFLAKHGHIAIPIEYRLSPEAKYPAAVDDIKTALDWILENSRSYNIDKNKIAILGCSAGAQLAGLVGLTYVQQNEENYSRSINAIINIDGIMDFTSEEARKHEDNPARKTTAAGRWFGARYSEKAELWKEASPVYYVNKYSPPILFINSSMPRFHVGRDEVIQKLEMFSIYSQVHTFEDAPHSFWLFDPWFERTGMYIVQFLENVLNQHK